MKIINLEQRSPEWLAWRRNGIGSSDIAAICGVCPKKSAVDVYNEKKGLTTTKMNPAMQRGIDYEDEARNVFCKSSSSISQSNYLSITIEHDDEPFFIASLDGYNNFTRCVLEIKIPARKVLNMAALEQIPLHYLYQIQWQLYVAGSPKGYYFCYNPDTLESYTIDVYPNESIREKMVKAALEFKLNLEMNIPPEPKRKGKLCSDDAAVYLKLMIEAKAQEKGSAERYKMLLDDLLILEGMDDSLEYEDVILARSERSNIDYKKAAEDAGVDLENYKKPTTVSWTIRRKSE